MKKILLGLVMMMFLSTQAFAQVIPTMDFFHGRECPHCHKEKAWFDELREVYPDIKINEYEVWHDAANAALAKKRVAELGGEFSGVPTNIIGDEIVVGFNPEGILAALEAKYGPGQVTAAATTETNSEESSWFMRLLDTILSWFGV